MDTVVARGLGAVAVHAAAGYYSYVGTLADEEIVVDQVVNVGVCHAGGDIDSLALCAGLHRDVYSGLVRFGINSDVLGIFSSGAGGILPDIIRAPESGHAVVVGYYAEHFRGHIVEAVLYYVSHCSHQPFRVSRMRRDTARRTRP